MKEAVERKIISRAQIEAAKILYGKQSEHIYNKRHKKLTGYFSGLFWRFIKLNKSQRKHVRKTCEEIFKIE